MTSPIELAKASVPFWMRDIKLYNAVEVHPVRDTSKDERHQGRIPADQTWCEPCEPHEAEFWSVFSHLIEGGLECFEDFATEVEAEAFAVKLRQAWPHLRG